jgi:hypothetical protein
LGKIVDSTSITLRAAAQGETPELSAAKPSMLGCFEGRMKELDETDRLCLAALDAAKAFGEACSIFRDKSPLTGCSPLRVIIRSLVIELGRRRFTQDEIDTAFLAALNDMDRHRAAH